MNVDFGELFKRVTSLFVVLGVILIVIAAVGTFPTGNQASVSVDSAWRYFLAACGVVLLLTGIFLTFRESKPNGIGVDNSKPTDKVLFLEELPPNCKKDLISAKEVWLIGSTLGKTISGNYDVLKAKLENGGNIRVLLVHPDGSPLEIIASRFLSPVNRNPVVQAGRIKEVLENFCSLKKLTPDRIQIRTIEYPLSFGVIAINPTQASGTLYIEHYPFRTVSGSMPKFVLKANDGQWYEFFIKEIQALWENGKEWKCS